MTAAVEAARAYVSQPALFGVDDEETRRGEVDAFLAGAKWAENRSQ